eukprot:gnl/TRDRNA2_/TRDRNA2_191158_c0_seq1.p1 gnl/TRDRNA2_/TRDRNA2_191158_c0~~gnl/TRDRNA2_/TRDRNA2_191158_c0_seq1.p1  ORF type:complete len:405 (+),score=127.74 gnl/TRDRNA2_/TRDRNA2_191158_c0_seq1:74-1288(+)
MAGTGENVDWISDFIVNMFRSPTWVMPIAQFIDQNCGSFEDVEENKLEHTEIHNNFKKLIDDLLMAHLSELSVTPEQFTDFCQRGLTGANELHRSLIEQLISAEDFLVFKAVMVKQNAIVSKEVFAELADPVQAVPATMDQTIQQQQEEQRRQQEEEDYEANRLELERLEAERRCLEAELALMMLLQAQLERRLQLTEAMNDLAGAVAKMEALQAALAAEEANALAEEQQPMPVAPPEVAPAEVNSSPAYVPPHAYNGVQPAVSPAAMSVAQRLALAKEKAAASAATATGGVTEEERQRRAEYLRHQRERLLAKKNQERAEQLRAHEEMVGQTTAAARAAERVCNGNAPSSPCSPSNADAGKRLAAELASGPVAAPTGQSEEQDRQQQEMRRALAQQLRATFKT